jgi:hypothetical protein
VIAVVVLTTLVAAVSPAATADANIDRGFLLPTAMTQPSGSLTYNNYMLLLHGITYALTDRLQVSATMLPPVPAPLPLVGSISLKGRIFGDGRTHLAAQGLVNYGDRLEESGDAVASIGAGILVSVCLRSDCSSLLSGVVIYQLAFYGQDYEASTGHFVAYGASVVHRVSSHVKLLGELISATASTMVGPDPFDNAPGLRVNYGLRLHGTRFACDLGFMKAVVTNTEDDDDFLLEVPGDEFLLGLPFINLSYRW